MVDDCLISKASRGRRVPLQSATAVQRWILQKVWGAAAECHCRMPLQSATAECHCRVPLQCSDGSCRRCRVPLQNATAECRMCSNGCGVSHFQILMNSAAYYQEIGPHFALSNECEQTQTITNPLVYR